MKEPQTQHPSYLPLCELRARLPPEAGVPPMLLRELEPSGVVLDEVGSRMSRYFDTISTETKQTMASARNWACFVSSCKYTLMLYDSKLVFCFFLEIRRIYVLYMIERYFISHNKIHQILKYNLQFTSNQQNQDEIVYILLNLILPDRGGWS